MTSSTSHSHSTTQHKKYARLGIILYALTLAIFIILLLVEPEGLDFRIAIIPLLLTLFLTGIAPARFVASKTNSRPIALIGTIALTILLGFIGLCIVVAAGWLIILARM